MRRHILTYGTALLATLGSDCLAQTPPPRPDSGQILRELEQAPTLRKPRTPAPATPDVAVRDTDLTPESAAASQTRVEVRGYQVSGNTVFSDEQLLALVAQQTGSKTLAEIEQIAAVITRYYRDHGYMVARAYLPYQEIRGGIVRLDILEGRYGELRVKNGSKIADRRLHATVERAACGRSCTGELIRERPLERGMLRLSDLPGIQVRGELQPGREVGTSDVVVNVEPTRGFRGSVDATNYGGRYVGRERATLAAAYANPLGIGDQVNFQGAYSQGSTYAGLGYDLPVNYRGTRLFVSAYRMDYELQEAFEALGAEGDTVGGEIGLTHSLFRDSRRSLGARVTYAYKSVKDDVAVVETSNERRASTYAATLDGALNDDWLGRVATNRVSLGYTAGELDIRDPLSAAIDAVTVRTDGHFDKMVYWLSRTQYITDRWSVYLRVTGQIAAQNLDSSEKFYLGGPSAVRAYPVGEAAGDRGYLASAEVRRTFFGPFGGISEVSAFYDRGHIRVDAQPWQGAAIERTLDGAGVGFDWSQQRGWSLAAAVAFRGSERATSGLDRDYQLWLSGGYRF
ncbi:ShlB/FhaC/HecB family hemolysin secretion/activation protein [Peristeroidobacter soli]|uniref:ShlB/FhaC/HecB family hemolysin secretion/activation protein n=1 Tax=Peristeroidobacter soli TaxID=2497877 RepID=UPI00101DA484|nr:ShlB/FhaC/HecB family hemolysin secretion/activation protein [Peristeroidobacter soli]